MACRIGISTEPLSRIDYWKRQEGHTHSDIVSGAGEAPGFQLDDGLKFQGSSSSMRLLGWLAAIFSGVSLSPA